jgi:hypothetical protein
MTSLLKASDGIVGQYTVPGRSVKTLATQATMLWEREEE